MKKNLQILSNVFFLLFSSYLLLPSASAQSPNKMSYQAVVRNSGGTLVQNSTIGMKISILQGSTSGTVVYAETQTPNTNINGLVSIEIGGGTLVTGSFTSIDWSSGPYFIKTETDPTGGTSYNITGTSQALSVPYALYSKTSASYAETDPVFIAWNKSSGINITSSQISDFTTSVTNNAAMVANTAKNSYPSADATKLAAITGTNTGDETTATIKTKLGITTLTGTNTGDQNLANVLTQGTDAGNNKIINVNQQGIGTATPNASSALEISSTTQGFLPPRMTYSQKTSITNPVAGLILWCKDCGVSGELQVYNGTTWTNMIGGTGSTALPSLSTTLLSSITGTTATCGGNITNDGGSNISARGVCWSISSNPTLADSKTSDGTGTGVFVSSITGLTRNTIYFVRAYATNSTGTAYGNEISFKTALVSIGDSYQGGIVAYLLQSGESGYDINVTHGLIASSSDQAQGTLPWYNGSFIVTGATGTAIGTGSLNTTTIIASQGNTGSYAAKICRDYTGGGYSDWYLPSLDELNRLYLSKSAIGGFINATYWSSSEYDINNAWALYFGTGLGSHFNTKNLFAAYCVRAIRSF